MTQQPREWEALRLKSCVSNVVDQAGAADDSANVVALENVESWTGVIRGRSSVDGAVKRFRRGDVLFGKLRPYLAKVALPDDDGACVGEFLVLRPNRGRVGAQFMAYLLRSKPFIDVVVGATSGAKMPRAEWDVIGSIRVRIPPRADQDSMVRFLDHADQRIRGAIRAKQKLIALLNEQKQAVIHRAVTRGLNPNVRLKPSGVEWLGDVPEHWEVWRIGRLGRIGNGSTPSRGNQAYWGGEYAWLNSSNVNRGRIDQADQFVTDLALQECHLPRLGPGTVLVAITGQGRTRGTAAILDMQATINQHIAYIAPRSDRVDSDYLRLSLIAAYPELRRMSDDSGSTKGALTCGDLSQFKVVLPPRDEQRRIIAAIEVSVEALEKTIAESVASIDLLNEYRVRLIADVVTGRLNVRDTAEALPQESRESELLDEMLIEQMDEPDVEELESVEA
jgi:type I restriction enzyme S subunit